MATESLLSRNLYEMASAASPTSILNGAVVFHLLNSSTSKFQKKNFGPTVQLLMSVIGRTETDLCSTFRVKCKNVYVKYKALKKHFAKPNGWEKLLTFLKSPFYCVSPTLHDHRYTSTNTIHSPPSTNIRSPPSTSTPLSRRVTSPPSLPHSPKKLRTDCLNCTLKRKSFVDAVSEIKRQRSRNHLMQKDLANVKRHYNKRTVDQRHRRSATRLQGLKETVLSLERRLRNTERANLNNSKRRRRIQKETSRLASLEEQLGKYKGRVTELEDEVTNLKKRCSSLELQIEQLSDMPASSSNSEASEDITTLNGNAFTADVRESCYFMLSHQVPVTACGPVLEHVIKTMTGKGLSNTPSTTTAAQMVQELGVISSLHVVNRLMSDDSNICLSWDATSVDGSHINEIHITLENHEKLTLDVKKIPGGTALDYTEHITSTFSNLAALFGEFYGVSEGEVLTKLMKKVTCTVTDRAPVNTCVVRHLRDQLEVDLLELHCNVHPLDGFARRARAALGQFDTGDYKCYGKDGGVANLIQAVSKLRYKAGSGDPEGFKDFLRNQKLPMSTFPRYVGNRLHILMHSAGIVFLHKDSLIEFLETRCTAGQLRTAVLHDLQHPVLVNQLWALGVMGKAATGPWMSKFYTSTEANLNMVTVLQASKVQLLEWEEDPTPLMRLECDLFNQTIDTQHPVCMALITSKTNIESRLEMLKALVTAFLTVFSTQLDRYTDGELTELTEAQKDSATCAPVHNMQSEHALGLLDGLWRRAPNATPGFLKGKVQFRLNNTLKWLSEQPVGEKNKLLAFALKSASRLRKAATVAEKHMCNEIGKRRFAVSRKRDTSMRNSLTKNVKRALRDERVDTVIPTDCLQLIRQFQQDSNSFKGLLIAHTWFEDDMNTMYYGRIRKVKQSKTKTVLVISYWRGEQLEVEASDYNIPVEEFFADMILSDLSVC